MKAPFLWSAEQLEDELQQYVNLIGSRWVMSNAYITLLPQNERTKFFEVLEHLPFLIKLQSLPGQMINLMKKKQMLLQFQQHFQMELKSMLQT